ncbi:hypothetical protein [Pseudomonas sp. D2002]|uniref:hypothetical protein n=1 Tax=Pseudomonas sp. D2002 TaxID=2726980 RepID=UPI0015A2002B|nr:hypothetical protein [Pseudomonas sp. D2002]NWA82965.1 hypothetical protein [Pseudomonas sp. D2002]
MTLISPSIPAPVPTPYNPPTPKQKPAVKIVHGRNLKGPVVSISVIHQRADIRIKKDDNNNVVAFINGKPYPLNIPNSELSTLEITTGRYRDDVRIDDNVKVFASIETGPGDDFVQTGGGAANVEAGPGDDHVQLGTGGGLVRGGLGNDKMFGGTGESTLHGGDGNNFFSTDIPKYSPKRTVIYSSGTEDTIRAAAGDVDITVYTGKTNIQVDKTVWASVRLHGSSKRSNITIESQPEEKKVRVQGEWNNANMIYK